MSGQLYNIKIDTIGVAKDATFESGGNTITCFEIPCTGSVNGVGGQSFSVKIFGKGGDSKLKNGMEFKGERSDYQGTIFYALKKANNPHLFKQADGSGFAGGKGGGFRPQHELNALQVAKDIVIEHVKLRECDNLPTTGAMAEEILKLARDKFIPYLRATTNRHDETDKREQTKEMQAAAIRQIIQNCGLADTVRSHDVKMSTLTGLYEQTGGNSENFILEIRKRWAQEEAAVPEIDDDDIPF